MILLLLASTLLGAASLALLAHIKRRLYEKTLADIARDISAKAPTFDLSRARRSLTRAKRTLRPSLLYMAWARRLFAAVEIRPKVLVNSDKLAREDTAKLSLDDFRAKYEVPALPVLITGLTASWPAATEWTYDKLLARFYDEKWKVGEDSDGNEVGLRFKDFFFYVQEDAKYDYSPLYIFDGSFGDKSKVKSKKKLHDDKPKETDSKALKTLLNDYSVPKYFKDDMFESLPAEQRPPYRWVCLGSARSGTTLHVDPNGTSAFNTVLQGHKRWVLFPPHTPRDVVKPADLANSEGITWFATIYPRLVTEKDSDGATAAEKYGMVEFIQEPGDTLFVPGGWWHAVINVDNTIAVTQNFASRSNADYVWLRIRERNPRLAHLLIVQQRALSRKSVAARALLKRLEALNTVPELPHVYSDSESDSDSEQSD